MDTYSILEGNNVGKLHCKIRRSTGDDLHDPALYGYGLYLQYFLLPFDIYPIGFESKIS